MSSIVSIETPKTPVTLGPDGSAEVSCVVKHGGGPTRRIGYRIVSEGGFPASTVSIRGPRARELQAGSSTELVVDVRAGSGLAPGDYRFSVLVFDVADPSERFDESGTVTLRVPAPEVVVPSRRRPWKIVAVAGVIVFFAGLGVLFALGFLSPQKNFAVNFPDAPSRSGDLSSFLLVCFALFVAPVTMAAAATRLGQPWSVVWLGALGVPTIHYAMLGVVLSPSAWFALFVLPTAAYMGYLIFDERGKSPSAARGSGERSA